MNRLTAAILFPIAIVILLISSCAGDIKGEKGDPGQDATTNAVIAIRRPSFRWYSADNTKLLVPATATLPAKVLISQIVYTNTSDAILSTSSNGAGGLDAGSLQAATIYYLYAIPAESGSKFDPIASTSPPSTGPSGFASWSYLGAFATDPSSAVIAPFLSVSGRYQTTGIHIDSVSHTGNTTTTAKSLHNPITAKFAIGTLDESGTGPGSVGFAMGFDISSPTSPSGMTYEVSGLGIRSLWVVPLDSPTTIYLKVNNSVNTVTWSHMGWIEDPAEWP